LPVFSHDHWVGQIPLLPWSASTATNHCRAAGHAGLAARAATWANDPNPEFGKEQNPLSMALPVSGYREARLDADPVSIS
jgi:hypothetical protein